VWVFLAPLARVGLEFDAAEVVVVERAFVEVVVALVVEVELAEAEIVVFELELVVLGLVFAVMRTVVEDELALE